MDMPRLTLTMDDLWSPTACLDGPSVRPQPLGQASGLTTSPQRRLRTNTGSSGRCVTHVPGQVVTYVPGLKCYPCARLHSRLAPPRCDIHGDMPEAMSGRLGAGSGRGNGNGRVWARATRSSSPHRASVAEPSSGRTTT